MVLAGTQYLIKRRYHIPFGGGSGTATLALAHDGRLFAALPGATEEELSGTGQPPGFPLQPSTSSGLKTESPLEDSLTQWACVGPVVGHLLCTALACPCGGIRQKMLSGFARSG